MARNLLLFVSLVLFIGWLSLRNLNQQLRSEVMEHAESMPSNKVEASQ